MPRTIEHIVETHQVAAERRKAGQPVWDFRVEIKKYLHNENLSFGQVRDSVTRALRGSTWFASEDEFSRLHEVVDGLSDAEDVEEFDGWLDEVYDLADEQRAWLG